MPVPVTGTRPGVVAGEEARAEAGGLAGLVG